MYCLVALALRRGISQEERVRAVCRHAAFADTDSRRQTSLQTQGWPLVSGTQRGIESALFIETVQGIYFHISSTRPRPVSRTPTSFPSDNTCSLPPRLHQDICLTLSWATLSHSTDLAPILNNKCVRPSRSKHVFSSFTSDGIL